MREFPLPLALSPLASLHTVDRFLLILCVLSVIIFNSFLLFLGLFYIIK